MDAKIAIVNAGEISSFTSANESCGAANFGKPALIVYRSPIVATGSLPSWTISVVTRIAIRLPGIFADTFGQKIWISSASIPIPNVIQSIV